MFHNCKSEFTRFYVRWFSIYFECHIINVTADCRQTNVLLLCNDAKSSVLSNCDSAIMHSCNIEMRECAVVCVV
jgi:hypothetical protein